MGFPPKQCAVVEDSEVGIAAALAAGMTPFQYLASDMPPYRVEDRVVFGNMSQLNPLVAEFADVAKH